MPTARFLTPSIAVLSVIAAVSVVSIATPEADVALSMAASTAPALFQTSEVTPTTLRLPAPTQSPRRHRGVAI